MGPKGSLADLRRPRANIQCKDASRNSCLDMEEGTIDFFTFPNLKGDTH